MLIKLLLPILTKMENFSAISNQNVIESAPIVIYVNGVEQTIGDSQSARLKPEKPRALVYQFFEWEEALSSYGHSRNN